MENNPFAENPYAAPPPIVPGGPPGALPPAEPSLQQLKIAGIILIVMAVLTILWRGFDLAFSIYMLANGNNNAQPGFFAGAVGGGAMAIVLNIVTIVGGFSMFNASSHQSAKTAAIISVIPLCSPCFIFGIPFGIWALVLLAKPEVKRAFRT